MRDDVTYTVALEGHGYRKRKQVVFQRTNYWICVIAVQQVSAVNVCDAWNAPCRGVHGPYTPSTAVYTARAVNTAVWGQPPRSGHERTIYMARTQSVHGRGRPYTQATNTCMYTVHGRVHGP